MSWASPATQGFEHELSNKESTSFRDRFPVDDRASGFPLIADVQNAVLAGCQARRPGILLFVLGSSGPGKGADSNVQRKR